MNIDDDLYDNIVKYCELNNKNLNVEINNMLRIGFSIVKYGSSPFQKMKEQFRKESVQSLEHEKQEKSKESTVEVSEKPKKTIRIIKNK